MTIKQIGKVAAAVVALGLALWISTWIWARTLFNPVELGQVLSDYLSNRTGYPTQVTRGDIRMSLRHGMALSTSPLQIGTSKDSGVSA